MPNTFITPSVIASRGLATLYNSLIFATLIWRDFDADFTGDVGDTVNARIPAVFEAEEFDRSAGVTIQDVVEDTVPIVLDTIANVSWALNDEQQTLEISNFGEQVLTPALEAIVQKVEGDVAAEVAEAAVGAGGGGTVDEGGGDANVAVRAARRVLSRNKAPMTDRSLVLSPEGTEEATGDELFVQANKSGSTDALRESNLGRVFGFDSYESNFLGFGPGEAGEADGVAFQRQAVALAIRPLVTPQGVAPNMADVKSYKQLSLRVVYAYNLSKKRDEASVDLLYGLETLRPSLAVEVDLGQGS